MVHYLPHARSILEYLKGLFLKEQAYKQLVLPLLEYCAPIRDPHHQTDINKLESVQRRAARFILNKPWNNNLDRVTVMLNDLKWPTLQSHHKYFRLILLFKVVNRLQLIPEQYLDPSILLEKFLA